ncbi:MAG: GxxExxY protein [Vicinamibacterales bacterium]
MLKRVRSSLDPRSDELVTQIIGSAVRVHRTLGPGYREGVYQDALAIELEEIGLPLEREVYVPLAYRGKVIKGHRLDLVVDRRVVVELKAVARLDGVHVAQVLAYLKSSGLRVGLLMNFNAPTLKSGLKRIVR